jgi:DamX protein
MAQEALSGAAAAAPAAGPPPAGEEIDCAPWLAAQPAGHYSIQFMSSPDPAAAQEYRARQPLPGPWVICRYPHKGRTWYAVLWGSHPDLAAARHAVAGLPPERRAEQPWIRSIQSLRRARAAP